MRTRTTLQPGQPGTKKLLEKYGDRLVNVRYRYDARRRRRYKTVELILEEAPCSSEAAADSPQDRPVGLRVEWQEKKLRELVKKSGGSWNPEDRVWKIRYSRVQELNLKDRIVRPSAG